MNILYIIGNGFDLNLGMKTRYSDFYKSYKSIKSPSTLIDALKENISNDIENWSDLELELGRYTKNLNSIKEFEEVYEDIGDNLGEYLKQEENSFKFGDLDERKFFNYISHPENTLPATDKNQITSFKKPWRIVQWNINIITFNYTRTLELLLADIEENTEIGKHRNKPIVLQKIEHIHGYYDNRMVMGVNDNSQISNSSFHDEMDIIDALVKPSCNLALKHNLNDWFKKEIKRSNLLCIFGSSIGSTDNIWWELIGEQLKREKFILIIFYKANKIPVRREYKRERIIREKKQSFLNKTKLSDEDKESVSDKIFIGINTDMFNLTN